MWSPPSLKAGVSICSVALNPLGVSALGCTLPWPKPQGILVHRKPVAAGSGLVCLPITPLGTQAFSLSPVGHASYVHLHDILLLMVTVAARTLGISSMLRTRKGKRRRQQLSLHL